MRVEEKERAARREELAPPPPPALLEDEPAEAAPREKKTPLKAKTKVDLIKMHVPEDVLPRPKDPSIWPRYSVDASPSAKADPKPEPARTAEAGASASGAGAALPATSAATPAAPATPAALAAAAAHIIELHGRSQPHQQLYSRYLTAYPLHGNDVKGLLMSFMQRKSLQFGVFREEWVKHHFSTVGRWGGILGVINEIYRVGVE